MRSGLVILVFCLLAITIAAAADIKSQQDEMAGQLIFDIVRLRQKNGNINTDEQRALAGSLSFLFLQLERSKSKGARVALANTYLLNCDAGCSDDRQTATLAHGLHLISELKQVSQRHSEICLQPNLVCIDKKKVDIETVKAVEMLKSNNNHLKK